MKKFTNYGCLIISIFLLSYCGLVLDNIGNIIAKEVKYQELKIENTADPTGKNYIYTYSCKLNLTPSCPDISVPPLDLTFTNSEKKNANAALFYRDACSILLQMKKNKRWKWRSVKNIKKS